MVADNFRRYSLRFLHGARQSRHDEADLIARVREARAQFEAEMQSDRERRSPATTGWHGGEAG